MTMRCPRVDQELTLQTDFGKTTAICTEVLPDSMHPEGVLLKVMARGPFEEGKQCWIIEQDGSKIGATIQSVAKQTVDSEVLLSTIFA